MSLRSELQSIGQEAESGVQKNKVKTPVYEDFVLEKNIFNNVFEKDIRRVFIYKKTERIAKALHLIRPAFRDAGALKDKLDTTAVALVESALLPGATLRSDLARELLALSSILTIARTSGLLSAMNADLLVKEIHFLIQEVAAYEEPRLDLEESPSLAAMTNQSRVAVREQQVAPLRESSVEKERPAKPVASQGQIKDRQAAVLEVIGAKGQVNIKDIAHMVRGVSEKTIQRELGALIEAGKVVKRGERRWSVYALA